MDVFRLGAPYTSSYQPDMKIEGYSSMIWTERFQEYGDFELVTPKIEDTRLLLPIDTLVSHLETDDVHIVESHTIEVDEFGRPQLKITGRSLDAFIEHRHVEGKYGKKRKMHRKYTAAGAVSVLLWQAFNNDTGKDVTRDGDFNWNTDDYIQNVVITESAAFVGESRNRWMVKGPLAPQIKELLTKGDMGIRVIRPHDGSDGEVISVKATPVADRGNVSRTPTTGIMALRFDIYDGIDRSTEVKFRTLHGDLDSVQYLFSKKEYKTAIEIMTNIPFANVHRNNDEKAFTGIRRRVGSLDVGEPDVPDEPKRPKDPKPNATQAEKAAFRKALGKWRDDHDEWENERTTIIDEFRDDVIKDAERLLKDTRYTTIVSGDVSPLVPHRFKVDYNLGDLVTLFGDHGLETAMLVTEHTRTEDATGEHGYPGLTLP